MKLALLILPSRQEKYAAIGENLGEAKQVMDATGLVVSPGMVDAHTHISEPGRTHWRGMKQGLVQRPKVASPQ
jgi:Dihydroorotase and related cyclic amidohydrolases